LFCMFACVVIFALVDLIAMFGMLSFVLRLICLLL